ncbi:MAG TPA: hypothetical protein DDY17_06385 [Syntrophaceae bacterium]|nr:hypothetical protein [Syntrophaceae bacterium]
MQCITFLSGDSIKKPKKFINHFVVSMKIAFLRKNPEEGQILDKRREMTPADKRLGEFVKRVEEDMAKNKISQVEGNRLIIKSTLFVNMLTRI